MLNPSYLIQSRHNVYYFRYPLGNKRLCVSLKTRCRKEALRLAKMLDYHSAQIIKKMEWESASQSVDCLGFASGCCAYAQAASGPAFKCAGKQSQLMRNMSKCKKRRQCINKILCAAPYLDWRIRSWRHLTQIGPISPHQR